MCRSFHGDRRQHRAVAMVATSENDAAGFGFVRGQVSVNAEPVAPAVVRELAARVRAAAMPDRGGARRARRNRPP